MQAIVERVSDVTPPTVDFGEITVAAGSQDLIDVKMDELGFIIVVKETSEILDPNSEFFGALYNPNWGAFAIDNSSIGTGSAEARVFAITENNLETGPTLNASLLSDFGVGSYNIIGQDLAGNTTISTSHLIIV
jgi:hypothetical protein